MNICFYTVFIGENNNKAFNIPNILENNDNNNNNNCYFYTNNKLIYNKLLQTNWKPIFVDFEAKDDNLEYPYESVLKSKEFKTCPHNLKELTKYDYSCYFDSKIANVNIQFVKTLWKKNLNDFSMLFRVSSSNKSIYDEFNASIGNKNWQKRYKKDKIKYEKYIDKKLKLGCKKKNDLFLMGGFIIRNMKHKITEQIGTVWQENILSVGVQDQITLFFIYQKYKKYIIGVPIKGHIDQINFKK